MELLIVLGVVLAIAAAAALPISKSKDVTPTPGKAPGTTPRVDWRKYANNPKVVERIEYWARARGLAPEFIAAFVKQESDFVVDAVNPGDPSYGLMQVTPLIARAYGGWTDSMGVNAIKDIDINLKAGTGFILHLIKRYGNLDSVIQAYNLGETKFDQGKRAPGYLASVLSHWRDFGGKP